MSLLTDFWTIFTAAVNAPGNLSQTAATDLLQVEAPSLTDQQGDDWFVAVATEYNRLGIITQPTYVQLRTEVNQSGEIASNDLFEALQAAIVVLPETRVVDTALEIEARTQELTRIPALITIVEGNKAATTDSTLLVAYDQAITVLIQRENELKTILGEL